MLAETVGQRRGRAGVVGARRSRASDAENSQINSSSSSAAYRRLAKGRTCIRGVEQAQIAHLVSHASHVVGLFRCCFLTIGKLGLAVEGESAMPIACK